MSKDAYDTCVLVSLLGNIVAGAMQEMSIDVVIESLSAVLGGAICQKHKLEVRDPLVVAKQIVEAADKLIMDNKKPLVPDPSNN